MIPNKEYERITKEAMKGTDDIDKVHLAIEETLSTLTTAVKDTLKEIEERMIVYNRYGKEKKTNRETRFIYAGFQTALEEATQIIKKNFCTESKTSSQKLRGLR